MEETKESVGWQTKRERGEEDRGTVGLLLIQGEEEVRQAEYITGKLTNRRREKRRGQTGASVDGFVLL